MCARSNGYHISLTIIELILKPNNNIFVYIPMQNLYIYRQEHIENNQLPLYLFLGQYFFFHFDIKNYILKLIFFI